MKNLGKLKNGQLKQSGCFNANFGFSLLSRKFPALLLVLLLLLLFLLPATRMRAQSSCPTGLGESAENPFLIPDTATFHAFARCLNPGSAFYYDCDLATFTITEPTTPGHFVTIAEGGAGKYFKLTANLVLNRGNVSGSNGVNKGYNNEPWRVWEAMHTFNGHFDGDFHTISGLFLPNGGDQSGLFYSVSTDGSVKNLGVTNSYISGRKFTGGIAGSALDDGTIQNCFFEGSIRGGDDYCGGIVGMTEGSSLITNCYTSGSIYSKGYYCGGIVGGNRTTVSNCYSSMYVSNSTGGGTVGGVYGRNNGGEITNCFYDLQMTDLTTNPLANAKLTVEMTVSSFTNLGSAFVAQGGYYPYLAGFDFANNPAVRLSVLPIFFNAVSNIQYETAADLTEDFSVGVTDGATWAVESWNNCVTLTGTNAHLEKQGIADLVVSIGDISRTYIVYPNIAPFLGTAENPFTIDNLDELITFRNGINSGMDFIYKRYNISFFDLENIHWLLTTDINLASIANWTTIGNANIPFKGHFNGGDHTIDSLTVKSVVNGGLFGVAEKATISHLTFSHIYVNASEAGGAVCGLANASTIEYCTALGEGSFIHSNNRVGGIIGSSTWNTDTMIVRYCTNYVDIGKTTRPSNGGGIGGYLVTKYLFVDHCYNYGYVFSTGYTGGVIGTINYSNGGTATVQYCYNGGDVKSSGGNCCDDIGGMCGVSQGATYYFCVNTGTITGDDRTGGITGWGSGHAYYCINTGYIKRLNSTNGGTIKFSGIMAEGTAHYCINTGKVENYDGAAYGVKGERSINAGEIISWNSSAYGISDKTGYNIGRLQGVTNYAGSAGTVPYDVQMQGESDIIGTSKNTEQMLGEGIKSILNHSCWKYTDGMYPRIYQIDTCSFLHDLSVAIATPIIFSSEDQNVNNVKHDFKIFGCDSNITWHVKAPAAGQDGGCLFANVSAGSNLPTTDCNDNAIIPAVNTYQTCIARTDIAAVVANGDTAKRISLRPYILPPQDTLCINSEADLIALRDGINSDDIFLYDYPQKSVYFLR